MKKFILLIAIIFYAQDFVNAQVIPKFQFGLKGGVNLSKLSEQTGYSSENRSGYLFGVWARAGAMGIHVQPELYYTLKTAEVKDTNGQAGTVDFTSVDLPVLLGTKIGALGIGARLQTGPVISFILDDKQNIGTAAANAAKFNYKDQAVAWQFGAGLDVKKLSVDLRYERGLSKISRTGYQDTKLNLFNLSLGLRLY
ncbi:MAG: PorT family protein [Pyrinomonadaceae bacterium]|nr:PorT family protein [Sphingobacteriaceae bacterium]